MKRFSGVMLLSLGLGVLASADEGLFEVWSQPDRREAVSIKYMGNALNVYSGPVLARFDSGNTFDAYCVDLDHWNTLPTAYMVKTSPINTLQYGARAAYLYNAFSSGVDTKEKGAALQLAIWDVVTDGGDGFTSGNFEAMNLSQNVKDMAHAYLTQSSGQSGMGVLFEAVDHGTHGDRNQNFLGPVPEPATMTALGLGLAALLRRRKKQ